MSEITFKAVSVLGKINANFDEVEHSIQAKAAEYDGVLFTEDTKADAKRVVADLRKEKKNIADIYKQIKQEWMKPLDEFKQRVDELAAKVDKPIGFINGQVEAFEQKRLEERDAEIKAMYQDAIDDMVDFLPLHKIRKDKWNNASTTVKTIRKEMLEAISTAKAGKAAIEAMMSDAVPDALRKFQATLDLTDALSYINQYEAQRAEVLKREEEHRRQDEERRHRAEIERIRQEERTRVETETRIQKEAAAAVVDRVKSVDAEKAAPLSAPESCTVVYTVVCTDEEMRELEMAMDSLGLYYERKDV